MEKILYIIPGYGGTQKDLTKAPFVIAAKKKGYRVELISIHWLRRVPTQWIAEAAEQITQPDSIVLGFSLGAIIAVMLARQIKFKKLLIASLSPFFADDLKSLPKSWKTFVGTRRLADLAHYRFPTGIKTPADFFAGSTEGSLLLGRVKKSYALWSGPKTLQIIDGVGHDIDHPAYTAAVLKSLPVARK